MWKVFMNLIVHVGCVAITQFSQAFGAFSLCSMLYISIHITNNQ